MSNLIRAKVVAFVALTIALQQCLVHATISDECQYYWGPDRGHITSPDSLELGLDQSGGSGIASKVSYMYGSVTMEIKLVQGNAAGTVGTFYLSSTMSTSSEDRHDEIDFEFLGNVTGELPTIHTNIYTQGFGKREQQFKPWFNASDGYHNYTIFWNPYEVVWLVDSVPIRVFRNYHDSEINYPDAQPMSAYASLWNADQWATQGGKVKSDWSLAPFKVGIQNYNARTCYCPDAYSVGKCSSNEPANWWTDPQYFKLSDSQLGRMNWVRNNYMIYNYCTDTLRYNGLFPKECSLPQY